MLKTISKALIVGIATASLTSVALAQSTKLRIQTHFSQETLSGQMAGRFVENVKNARQAGSYLRGQPNALAFTT